MSALLSSITVACSVCFQADDSATTTGLRIAVATLVLITGGVLTGFGLFIRRFIARSKITPGVISDVGSPEITPGVIFVAERS